MSVGVAFFLGLSVGVAAAIAFAIWVLHKIGDALTIRW